MLLTNADLDHTLGLILMRQHAGPLNVYTTDEIQSTLRWINPVLEPFEGIRWHSANLDFSVLDPHIMFRALKLNRSLAFQFRDKSNRIALIAPAVDEITDELRAAAHESQVVLFDGTFWSNDELGAVRPGARTAREMHHLPISEGSLDFLRNAPAQRKLYTHINNTNPILSRGSTQRSMVEQVGIEIAYDGLEIIL